MLRRSFAWLIALGSIAVIVGGLQIPEVSWRVQVLTLKFSGQLEDLSWKELVSMLSPGSRYYVRNLVDNPNPYAVVRNPYSSPEDRVTGAILFREHCGGCHGLDGRGGHGPDLVGGKLKTGDSEWAIFRTTQRGVPGTSMNAVDVDEKERWQIVGHLAELRKERADVALLGSSRLVSNYTITASDLEHSENSPSNWLTYSGGYSSWRYSSLDQMSATNAADISLSWTRQFNVDELIETSPIVVDGVMFLTLPPSDVVAVDASSGEVIWEYRRPMPKDVSACCGRVNRGVAVIEGRVYLGTLDAHLVALDAKTGTVVWDVEIEPYKQHYSVTAAPLAVRNKIIVGMSGGDYGARGFLDAYDVATGTRQWRFYTVPRPNELGGDTWSGDSWKKGGGPTWLTGSFDPASSHLFWSVGNPWPDFDGNVRMGDNLFTNSIVALDLETGRLIWHFQFTPHDEHDWDANQIPVLIDHDVEGTKRPLMLFANRNGYYYVLDRSTGELLTARPFARQNWSTGIDQDGRPILSQFGSPTEKGTLTWPGASGATNWWSPSFSPKADLFYVPYLELPAVFFSGSGEPEQGTLRGGTSIPNGESVQTGVRALKPTTGEIVWDYKMPPRVGVGQIGGILSTGGNLVFVGDYETFYALDANRGEKAWSVRLGGRINAGPVTFESRGRQMVAIAAGNSVFAFSISPRL